MATDVLEAYAEPSADIYFRIRNAAGLWFDFDDDTFKAWASATTPYIVATESALHGGTAEHCYRASLDLALVNSTPDPVLVTVEACDNATPALADDRIAEPAELLIQSGRLAGGDELVAMCDGGFTSSAGTEYRMLAWLEQNGQKLALAAGSCSITIREHGAGADLFTITDAAPNAAGVFELTKSSPGFTDDRVYAAHVTITVNSIAYTTTHGLQVQSA